MYKSELEEVEDFQGLTDFCSTFKLQRGKNDDDEDDPTLVGEFKVRFPGRNVAKAQFWDFFSPLKYVACVYL